MDSASGIPPKVPGVCVCVVAKKALREFSRLLTLDPNNLAAKLGAGESLLAMGNYALAGYLFWDAKFKTIDQADYERLKIGRILSGIHIRKYDDPELTINDGLLIWPNDARLWNAKGQYYDSQGEWSKSLSAYIAALNTGQSRSATINNMGMSLLLQGRYIEARGKFKQAIQLNPKRQVYDNNLRMVHILTGDIKKALDNIKLDNIKDTRTANILNDAGYVAMQLGQTELAQLLFSKALETSPIHHAKAQKNRDKLFEINQAQLP